MCVCVCVHAGVLVVAFFGCVDNVVVGSFFLKKIVDIVKVEGVLAEDST